ncbi:MAG TPA: hypothetical protein VMN82_11130 [Thermoanaerobaculia bacterium]|nr:hypothetical protein [Thermoanaerobaculia bacterium]
MRTRQGLFGGIALALITLGTAGGAGAAVVPGDGAAAPCTAGPATLCLLDGRFRVEVSATDAAGQGRTPGRAIPGGDRFGSFSLPAITGDAELPEVVVKMVDATATPWESFWFFQSSLTSLPYAVTVVDTITGSTRSYEGGGICGEADTRAFPLDPAPATAAGASKASGASGGSLSLLSGRFRVELTATDPSDGQSVEGVPVAGNDRHGYFSLPALTGDPSLPEVAVKMIDARSLTGTFWFFSASLTGLGYTLRVTDTVTGSFRAYDSQWAFCGGFDTSSFLEGPPPSDISGDWTGFFDPENYKGEDCETHVAASATIVQHGDAITGSCRIDPGACFRGGQIEGTITGNSISGHVLLPGFVGGAFTGTATDTRLRLRIEHLSGAGTGIPPGALTLRRSSN